MHAYIHIYIYTPVHTYAYIHTYMNICIHTQTYPPVRTQTYICMHIHAHTDTLIHIHIHTCMHTNIHAGIHTCTDIHTCMDASLHTDIHTYIQTDRRTDRQRGRYETMPTRPRASSYMYCGDIFNLSSVVTTASTGKSTAFLSFVTARAAHKYNLRHSLVSCALHNHLISLYAWIFGWL